MIAIRLQESLKQQYFQVIEAPFTTGLTSAGKKLMKVQEIQNQVLQLPIGDR